MKPYFQDQFLTLFQADCLDAMREMPDNSFDLAICDPPYGGILNKQNGNGHLKDSVKKYGGGNWDFKPSDSYFNELFRVTQNQIIWGANYFTEHLRPSAGWIVWDKKERISFADAELAWTSFDCSVKVFDSWRALIQSEGRIHPTQKPVQLYKFLLKHYAKSGQTILDTHGGSLSSSIACADLGYHLTAFELENDYCISSVKRYREHRLQAKLF